MKKEKLLLCIGISFCAIGVAFSILHLVFFRQEEIEQKEEMQHIYTTAGLPINDITEGEENPHADLMSLREKNPDCIAWLSIPGTGIDYPVMHTPEDPEYYLKHSFLKKENVYGVPFLDGRCTPNSDHLILYGHTTKDNTVFTSLHKYQEDKKFLENHRTLWLETVGWEKEYEIIAMDTVPTAMRENEWSIYCWPEIPENEWENFFHELSSFSYFDEEKIPDYGKQLLTLSTCTYTQADKRLVLVAAER